MLIKFIAKFNATEPRKMQKSSIRIKQTLPACRQGSFREDYHLSAVVLFYSLSPRVPASTN